MQNKIKNKKVTRHKGSACISKYILYYSISRADTTFRRRLNRQGRGKSLLLQVDACSKFKKYLQWNGWDVLTEMRIDIVARLRIGA